MSITPILFVLLILAMCTVPIVFVMAILWFCFGSVQTDQDPLAPSISPSTFAKFALAKIVAVSI